MLKLRPGWFTSKMGWSFALAALAALTLIGINETSHLQAKRALADIDQAQQSQAATSELMQFVLDAESGQRGYLLTNDVAYRKPYDQAMEKIDATVTRLRQLEAGRPQEQAVLERLVHHLTLKRAEMEMAVRLLAAGNGDASQFVIATDVGRTEMIAIRQQAAELITLSTQSLAAGQTQIARALTLARAGIAVVALAGLLAFILYLRQTRALQQAGERQQLALQRERNSLEQEVHERTTSLAQLATHLQQVREQERGFLARELHDELGALLTAAKLDVARLRSRLDDQPDATTRLQHLTEQLNAGIALKRRIIEDLRPSSLSNLGLIASLEILGREFGERAGLQVDMALEAVEPHALDESRQLTIYRLVQEGLTNISKYAEATSATIVLRNYRTHVLVELQDDGKGFDASKTRPATHGLAGMRHRVEAAGGKFTITSAPGQGTRLQAMMPAQTPVQRVKQVPA